MYCTTLVIERIQQEEEDSDSSSEDETGSCRVDLQLGSLPWTQGSFNLIFVNIRRIKKLSSIMVYQDISYKE